MYKIKWYKSAKKEYLHWVKHNKDIVDRINKLLKDTKVNPFEGKGKPEPLKHDFAGHWSRRIDRENRLVYKVSDSHITIVLCRGHYE